MPAETTALPYAATIKDAVRLSGLSKTAIYGLLRDGKVEAKRRGRTTLVLMKGVRQYLDGLPKARFGSGAPQ